MSAAEGVRAALAEQIEERSAQLDALALELAEAVVPDSASQVSAEASRLIREYVADRILLEATVLIDPVGEPRREVEPFRDSLVHGLALVVVACLLDTAAAPLGIPQDANPEAVLGVLDHAYQAVEAHVTG